MADLLGSDIRLAESHRIYEVHDHLLAHKQTLFSPFAGTLTRLRELSKMKLKRDTRLIKIGQAKARAGRVFSLVDLRLPEAREPVNTDPCGFTLDKNKLREGNYLLRAFAVHGYDTAQLCEFYRQLAPSLPLSRALPCLRQAISLTPLWLGSRASRPLAKTSREISP